MYVLGAVGGSEVVGMVIGWVASIVLTGWMANKKGRSVVGWSLLAVFIVLWAFVIVALLPSKRESQAGVAPQSPVTGEVDRLAELRDLHAAGVLSDEEFETKKSKVLTGV